MASALIEAAMPEAEVLGEEAIAGLERTAFGKNYIAPAIHYAQGIGASLASIGGGALMVSEAYKTKAEADAEEAKAGNEEAETAVAKATGVGLREMGWKGPQTVSLPEFTAKPVMASAPITVNALQGVPPKVQLPAAVPVQNRQTMSQLAPPQVTNPLVAAPAKNNGANVLAPINSQVPFHS